MLQIKMLFTHYTFGKTQAVKRSGASQLGASQLVTHTRVASYS